MARFTQEAIIRVFLDMLHKKSLEKITVKDIVEACEINRNTFYYYYQDVYDLLDDIFRRECDSMMEAYREDSTMEEEYRRIFHMILDYRTTVLSMYRGKSQEIIEKYVNKAGDSLIRRFVQRRAAGCELKEGQMQFIVDFYKYSIIGYTMAWVQKGMPGEEEDFISQITDAFEATVSDLIQNCVQGQKNRQKDENV